MKARQAQLLDSARQAFAQSGTLQSVARLRGRRILEVGFGGKTRQAAGLKVEIVGELG